MPSNEPAPHVRPTMKQGKPRDDSGEDYKDLVAMVEGCLLQYMIARRMARSENLTMAERHLFHTMAHTFLRAGEALEPLMHVYGHCSDDVLEALVKSMVEEEHDKGGFYK